MSQKLNILRRLPGNFHAAIGLAEACGNSTTFCTRAFASAGPGCIVCSFVDRSCSNLTTTVEFVRRKVVLGEGRLTRMRKSNVRLCCLPVRFVVPPIILHFRLARSIKVLNDNTMRGLPQPVLQRGPCNTNSEDTAALHFFQSGVVLIHLSH